MASNLQQGRGNGLVVQGLTSAVLHDVSLSLTRGEGRAIVGPSGSGKTSLFRAISDLDPNRGDVHLNGRSRESFAPADWRRRVAYVPAEPAWWLTTAGDHADAPAWDVAERLGLSADLMHKSVKSLSTGERQRLALACALARQPDVLLLDEPTSALDDDNRDDAEAVIAEALAGGAILLIASHDPGQIERLRLRTIHVDGGRITEEAAS